jgi:hypothetical protein
VLQLASPVCAIGWDKVPDGETAVVGDGAEASVGATVRAGADIEAFEVVVSPEVELASDVEAVAELGAEADVCVEAVWLSSDSSGGEVRPPIGAEADTSGPEFPACAPSAPTPVVFCEVVGVAAAPALGLAEFELGACWG